MHRDQTLWLHRLKSRRSRVDEKWGSLLLDFGSPTVRRKPMCQPPISTSPEMKAMSKVLIQALSGQHSKKAPNEEMGRKHKKPEEEGRWPNKVTEASLFHHLSPFLWACDERLRVLFSSNWFTNCGQCPCLCLMVIGKSSPLISSGQNSSSFKNYENPNLSKLLYGLSLNLSWSASIWFRHLAGHVHKDVVRLQREIFLAAKALVAQAEEIVAQNTRHAHEEGRSFHFQGFEKQMDDHTNGMEAVSSQKACFSSEPNHSRTSNTFNTIQRMNPIAWA